MRRDLDVLMRRRQVDALIVPLHEAMHASFRWLARGAKLTRGYAVRTAGGDDLLIHYPMERDEAARCGVSTRSIHEFHYTDCFRSAANPASAYAQFFDGVLREIGLVRGGTVAFSGNLPIHLYAELLEEFEQLGWTLFRGAAEDLVSTARKTKEPEELEAIASVGQRTEQVVSGVREILRTSRISKGVLHQDGRPLTIGDLKKFVSGEIVRAGLIEDHDTILSQGRDAAVPHSRGTATDAVRASMPLVIDIFPRDRESGYFFDLTRTYCPGDVPPRLQEIHRLVDEAFVLAATAMRSGTRASTYQSLVCDYFESRGHRTTRSHPTTSSGYVHSLGHGVGLDVHERPSFSLSESNYDEIEAGDVVTIEPGLYYPDEAIGVRIEDTFYIDPDGRAVSFCTLHRGLEP